MVGDGPQDMRAAAALPMPAIGVLWGQSTHETLEHAGASRIVQAPEELARVLSAT
jgi:phosphoglycolate phosphatase-like HAD superfamily hydrolase